MNISPALQGFGVGASLIIAIGPQNAFVLNQGLKRHHVLLTALFCSVADAILICAGILGLGAIFNRHPALIEYARWFGALFLTLYGALSFKSAFKSKALIANPLNQTPIDIKKTIVILLGLAFLNPHVYLDTVVLIGSIAAQHQGIARLLFGAGAICASIVWFFALAFGARMLSPLFKQPSAWRILDIIIGCVMWVIAYALIFKL